jgi:hypothetical protein
MTEYAPGIPEKGAVVGGLGAISKAVRAARLADTVRATTPEIRLVARGVRAIEVKGERARGQIIFSWKDKLTSYDIDGHGTGYWKVGKTVGDLQHRLPEGTLNKELTERVRK